jgi:hypothetical protein
LSQLSSTSAFSHLSDPSSDLITDKIKLPDFEMSQRTQDQLVEAKPLTVKYEDKQSKAEKQKIIKAFSRSGSTQDLDL